MVPKAEKQRPPAVSKAMPVGTKYRLGVPVEVLDALDGFPEYEADGVALWAELDEPGRVIFHLDSEFGDSHRAKLAKLEAASREGDDRATREYTRLERTFRPISLWKDKRMVLELSVVAHLEVMPKAKPFLHVRAINGKLEVLSMRFLSELSDTE